MNIDDVLDADWDAVGTLRNPVLVVALRGWFDVSGVATGALEWAIQDRSVTIEPRLTRTHFLISPKNDPRP